jgi:hypothetical protein
MTGLCESFLAEECGGCPDTGMAGSIVAYINTMKAERNSINEIGQLISLIHR